jgi:hypothetical protein
MWRPYANALDRPPRADRGWFRPPLVIALVLGAVLGLFFGSFAGLLRGQSAATVLWMPFGPVSGAVLGLLGGLLFVTAGLLLYPAIRDAGTGALVLGLFAMLAMLLVGGLFGAVVGLIAGALLGAFVGAVKAQGGLFVGSVSHPVEEPRVPVWRRFRRRREAPGGLRKD